MNARRIGLLAALLLPMACAAAPRTRIHQGYVIREWSAEDGLIDNDILSLCQDRDGFLWIGTNRGLMRFDGAEFRPWPLIPGQESLKSSVWALQAHPEGGLLVSGDEPGRGIFRLPDNLRPTPVSRLSGTPELLFRSIYLDRNYAVWASRWDTAWMRMESDQPKFLDDFDKGTTSSPCSFASTTDGKIYLSRGMGVEEWTRERGAQTIPGLPAGPLTLCAAAQGGLWVADSTRLYRWKDGKAELVTLMEGHPLDHPPYAMLETRDGSVWVATKSAGLLCWRVDRLISVIVPHPAVRCMMEDAEENLWIGTAGGGLCQLRKTSFDRAGENVADTIGSFCQDARGTRWIANSNGIWHLIGKHAVPAFRSETAPHEAQAVCPDQEGNVWIGTSTGLFRCKADNPEVLEDLSTPSTPPSATLALFCDRRGSMWAGSVSGPVLRFDRHGCASFGPDQGYTGSHAQAFGEDRQGNIWMGTRKGGLYRLEDGRFRELKTGLQQPLLGILSIHGDASGNVWIGTTRQGLLVHHKNAFTLLGRECGLPDTHLPQMLEDGRGRLWFGGNHTIFSVSMSELLACADGTREGVQAITYGSEDGISLFYATGQRQPCAWKTQDGRLNFLGRKGLVVHDPAHAKPRRAPPVIFIDGVWLDERESVPSSPLDVPAGTQSVRIRFTIPSFANGAEIRFRYRLKGGSPEWVENHSQRFVIFPRPPPGRYRFEVTATNPSEGWQALPAALEYDVLPFWWERTSVRLAGALAAALALAFTVRSRTQRRLRARMKVIDQENRIEQERTRIARDLHDGLGAGLTEAGLLAAELRQDAVNGDDIRNQPLQLGERIHALARELDEAVWAVSPRHDNLKSLCGYLCDYALEHFRHSSIRCLLEVDDQFPDIPIDPHVRHQLFMVVKESLNNVIKHSRATEVRLSVRMVVRTLEIRISDNGVSFDPALAKHPTRSGLRNMRDRMAAVGGQWSVEARPAHGTVVRIRISLPANSALQPSRNMPLEAKLPAE